MAKKKATGNQPDQKPNEPEELGQPEAQAASTQTGPENSFLIVGIGASAGGLEALQQFFRNMPVDSGMAFVIVQHQDPNREGQLLLRLLQQYTRLEVVRIEDDMPAQPNRVYLIPPDRDLAMLHGRFQLLEPGRSSRRLPIDFFFKSLAEDQGERAVGIILSGTATDGSLGLKIILQEGGMVMVQDPKSAQYDGMPRSAIATNMVDYILPPEEMPQQLLKYAQHADGQRLKKAEMPIIQDGAALHKIFLLLRTQTGHDFSYYKRNTIGRRIERRMVVNQIAELNDYLRYLQQNPLEANTLFRELLIGVTNFFRDPQAFAALQEKVIPALLAGNQFDEPVRIWVPGCATGEEVYSIAVLLKERMEALRKNTPVQIFATDIDTESIALARLGIYPDNIAAHVSAERLQRFFNKEDRHYHVKNEIREMVVFAIQDVLKDPPFSRLDLISCRNLMIYLQSSAQRRLLHLFHYGLRPRGFLFLGSSEAVSEFADLFSVVDRKWKIFKRTEVQAFGRPLLDFNTPAIETGSEEIRPAPGTPRQKVSLRDLAQNILLSHYVPPAVVVNEAGEALYFHGRTGRYLEPPSGETTWNLVDLARQDLKLPLMTALRRAVARRKEIIHKDLQVRSNGEISVINLVVRPIIEPKSMPGLLLVAFEPVALSRARNNPEETRPAQEENQHVAELEQELRATREYLQITTEELETSNEELKSTNEELQSANEELQSTNEELETSKEELQSVNEELITVNSELQVKIDELSKTNNDMTNLLASTEIGTIFLDQQLRVKGFTPAAAKHIKLISSDIGRPVSDIVANLKYDTMARDVEQVLATLVPRQLEVPDRDESAWYRMRIMPYRTTENVIDGVVITFIDITEQKRLEAQLRNASLTAEHAHSLVMLTDTAGNIEYVNDRLARLTGYTLDELRGQNPRLFKADRTPMDSYKELWANITAGLTWQGEFCNRKKDGSYYWEAALISPQQDEQGRIVGFMKVAHDITTYKQREEELLARLAVLEQRPADHQAGE